MNARPLLLVLGLILGVVGVAAAQDPASTPVLTVTKIERLKQPRNFENADLRDELSHLAREAKLVLEIQKEVCGTFTLKIDEPVAPYEALNRIADRVHLFFESRPEGGYIVWARADFKPSADAKAVEEKSPEQIWTNPTAIASATAEMAAKLDEGLSAYNAKPETAARRAKFYRNFYDALVKEGFSKEDAMRLTAAAGYPGQTDDKGAGSK